MTTALLPGEGIARAEQRIATLEVERQARIDSGEGDYAAAVAAIDAQISSQRSTILVYRQRAAAIERKVQARAAAKLAAERAAGIEEVRKRTASRHEAAAKLDAAVEAVRTAFTDLMQAEESLFQNWPAAVSLLGHLGHFHIGSLESLSARRIQRPPGPGIVRGIAERPPFKFAEITEARNRELVEMIETAPATEPEGAAA